MFKKKTVRPKLTELNAKGTPFNNKSDKFISSVQLHAL
ncbi:hypothetical protein MY9_0542 [Bacillus sp. JS]|nr:hypothetical protein MY9_0542 [Bacillus sp. JS]